MGYRRNAVDANQGEIVEELRKAGCTVSPTSQAGEGFPDLVVGRAGANYLLEVKDGAKPPSGQKLTPKQVKWHSEWTGQVHVVNSVEQAFEAVGLKGEKLKKLYMEIWEERPHVCANCGHPIPYPIAHVFSHIRSKGARPDLKYDKSNIELNCSSVHRKDRGCHELHHTNPEKYRERSIR